MRESQMVWACSAHGSNERNIIILAGKPERKTLLGDVGVDGKILLECISKN
jgi:hypothetical protein